jgi:hypothetical protein
MSRRRPPRILSGHGNESRNYPRRFSVPGWLSAIVAVLPVRALAQILEQGYTPVEHASLAHPFVLLAWTAAGCAFAAWRFRWH